MRLRPQQVEENDVREMRPFAQADHTVSDDCEIIERDHFADPLEFAVAMQEINLH